LLVVLDSDAARAAQLAETLETGGFPNVRCVDSSYASGAFEDDQPALLILSGVDSAADRLRALARAQGIPILQVLANGGPEALADGPSEADDWVFLSTARVELPLRAARLLRRRTENSGPTAALVADKRFYAMVVHDLRTPLNVIAISLRLIAQGMQNSRSRGLDEDLRFAEENCREIERMLVQLSDHYRLYEDEAALTTRFNPRRFLSEVIEGQPFKIGARTVAPRLIVSDSCPEEAELDPHRARLALTYALANASAASDKGPVIVTARGGEGRWVTEIAVNEPPPASVRSFELRPDRFERLTGTAPERRGLDLAIAARATELLGGTARLVVDAGRATTIVLDWPVATLAPVLA
jgi:signal transduction histidine kinase